MALTQSGAIASVCSIAGAHTLATYSLVMVYGIGTFVLCIYGLAFLLKFLNMLAILVCPICTVRMKLLYRR